jgi:hypothetical protein
LETAVTTYARLTATLTADQRAMFNELAFYSWRSVAQHPADALTMNPEAAVAALAWNDRNGDYDGAGNAAPYWLLRAMADDALLADFDLAQEIMGGHDGPDAHYGLAEELATLLDRATRDEAATMLDDWRDRCDLPDDLYESLYAYVQDNHDGGRV